MVRQTPEMLMLSPTLQPVINTAGTSKRIRKSSLNDSRDNNFPVAATIPVNMIGS